MAHELSNIQQRLLSSIMIYMKRNDGRPPTYREISQELRMKSLGHIAYHLKALEEKGYTGV